jgi:ABC-type transport system involved in cytochrome bd biosynthesis fused ATPase/permease subunit
VVQAWGPALVAGLTTAGVLAVCVHATADHRLDRVLVAALTLLAAAAFEAVAPLPPAALTLRATRESARRVLQIGARPPAVRVLLAGSDVRDLAQRAVRRRICLDAHAYLFATSILENVRLARPDADDAAVEEALRRARLGD